MSEVCLFHSTLNNVFLHDIQKKGFSSSELTVLLNALLQIYSSNPFLASNENRIATFAQWNKQNHQLTTNLAVENGFYHTGVEDETVCVSCGLGLKAWSNEDCPPSLHALYSPQCAFVVARSILVMDNSLPFNVSRYGQSKELLNNTLKYVTNPTEKSHEDAVANAKGLGHGDSIICLGVYRYITATSDDSAINNGPPDTISLLRNIMLVDDAMESYGMTESQLPQFLDLLQSYMQL